MGDWMSTGISTRSQMQPRPIVHLITNNGDGYRMWCTGSGAIESPAQTENWRHCEECKKLAVVNYEAEILGKSEVGRYSTFLPGQNMTTAERSTPPSDRARRRNPRPPAPTVGRDAPRSRTGSSRGFIDTQGRPELIVNSAIKLGRAFFVPARTTA